MELARRRACTHRTPGLLPPRHPYTPRSAGQAPPNWPGLTPRTCDSGIRWQGAPCRCTDGLRVPRPDLEHTSPEESKSDFLQTKNVCSVQRAARLRRRSFRPHVSERHWDPGRVKAPRESRRRRQPPGKRATDVDQRLAGWAREGPAHRSLPGAPAPPGRRGLSRTEASPPPRSCGGGNANSSITPMPAGHGAAGPLVHRWRGHRTVPPPQHGWQPLPKGHATTT